ncbi:hypothetical protein A3Q56_03924 [Intoshia linei]|uniref:Cytosol aminopeptidase domain-containing protein n=1 Tax=Intoshia linei TaxID=1819745 RepID=A0A177B243_9BILA|nr:hypothetical protein A3Q56_03924 [Intoshia linei]
MNRCANTLLRAFHLSTNSLSFSRMSSIKKGLVLGLYKSIDSDIKFTPTADKFCSNNDGLKKKIILSQIHEKEGKSALFFDEDEVYKYIVFYNLGDHNGPDFDEIEGLNPIKENVRHAAYTGVLTLSEFVDVVEIEDFEDSMCSAEGATLANMRFDEMKVTSKKKKSLPKITQYKGESPHWKIGSILSTGQNIARRLMEMPANVLTPTKYAEEVVQLFSKFDDVKVNVYDEKWIKEQKMGMFLSVAAGSAEPPKFVEILYKPKALSKYDIGLVGKGITHDTGGISLKPSSSMPDMRADMGGSANVVSTMYNLASLGTKINIIGCLPITENMPGGKATKPSDIVISRSGKSVQIDNTDAEGRLVLGDALDYIQDFDIVHGIIEMSTLTGAQAVALGEGATGMFSTCKKLSDILVKCGEVSGDRMWPMPYYKMYTKLMTKSTNADVNNIGCSRWEKINPAGACQAAAFLKEFIRDKYAKKYVHLDIAGVMDNKCEGVPYLPTGFSGRPTRTVTRALEYLVKI